MNLQLSLRHLQPGSTLAYAVHRLRDGTIVESRIAQDELDLFHANQHPLKQLPVPEKGARWLLSGGGRPRVDRVGGYTQAGDCFELNGTLCICLGTCSDFRYVTKNRSGRGFIAEQLGNYIYLDRTQYTGQLPFITLKQPLGNIQIVNGWIHFQKPQQGSLRSIDAHFPIHNSIAFDDSTFGEDLSVGSTVSYSHTATGSNLALFGAVMWDTTDASGSGTYNSVALSFGADAKDTTNGRYMTALTLLAPASGAQTAAYTGALSFNRRSVTVTFTGVDQSTGVRGSVGNTGTGDASTNITTVADDMVVDMMVDTSAASTAADAGQTERENVNEAPTIAGCSTKLATTTTTTMGWNNGAAGPWTHVLTAFKPAAAGIIAKSVIKSQAVNRASTY